MSRTKRTDDSRSQASPVSESRVEFEKPAARLTNLSERSLKVSKRIDPSRPLARVRLSDRLTITNKAKLQTSPKAGSTARESRGGVHARQVVVADCGRGPHPGGRPRRPCHTD